MSEDYKKIALEDVKKGQRVRIVGRHRVYTATFEGVVVRKDTDYEAIEIGEEASRFTIHVAPRPDVDFDIWLLEDAPKPKVVRTETVTITHYDDGTKTETPVKEVKAPMVIETMEQFEEYEDYLEQVVLKDCEGDYWTHRDGRWCWINPVVASPGNWIPTMGTAFIKANRPLTIVENVGD